MVESRVKPRKRGSALLFAASLIFHASLLLGSISLSVWAVSFPGLPPAQQMLYSIADVQTPPPAPPPAPPPPKKRVEPINPVEPVPEMFEELAPTMIPDLDIAAIQEDLGVESGVEGGVEGGVMGGEVGGVIGGVVGGVPNERQPGDAVVIARDANLPLKPISRVLPDYPDGARIRSIEGSVLVKYVIDNTGRVREVTVLEPAHKLLTEEAVRCIRSWRFRPLIVDGEPVEVIHELTVIFKLVS